MWTSYTPIDKCRLEACVDRVILMILGRMEAELGKTLVGRAVVLLSAARRGVTSNEMEDLLSMDQAVMAEVASSHQTKVDRLPQVKLYITFPIDTNASFLRDLFQMHLISTNAISKIFVIENKASWIASSAFSFFDDLFVFKCHFKQTTWNS